MFIDDENTEAIAERIVQLLRSVELEVMKDIIRRIKGAGEITRSADYQLWRINQISAFRGNYEKILKQALNLTDQELRKLYDEVIAKGYARDKAIYDAAHVDFIPFEDNIPLQQLIRAVKKQTLDTMENITATTGFIDFGKGVYTPLNQYMLDTLDRAHLEITTGSMSYDQAISKAVNAMVRSGMRTTNKGDQWVNYNNPGKRPWHNRIDVATRRAVMTGVVQVTGKISDENAEKLQTEYFEVSAHATARPTHLIWQGRVYSKDQLVSVCGLGTGPGLLGWNCYHHYDAFIPGISVRKYSEEELSTMRKKAREKKEYDGKEYTLYEATQRQRQLETQMRAQRQSIELLKAAGAPKQEIAAEKARLTAMYGKYREFSKEFGLPEQINRVYYRDLPQKKPKISEMATETFTDVTGEYVSGLPVKPGRVTEDEGYNHDEIHQRDIDTANWFAGITGKNVHLLKEQNGQGIHTPDSEIDGRFWEFKSVSSKNSVSKRIAEGLTEQIVKNPGGLILNLKKNEHTGLKMSDEELIQYTRDKLKFYQKHTSVDVVLREENRLIAVIRMNKK